MYALESWRHPAVLAVTLSVSVVGLAGPAPAQQIQASLIGHIEDESGSVLPGVTVTVTSPALQVPSMVVVTNQRGDYRVTPLPIGTYQVVYELPGFQTLRREGLRLTAGFVAREDIVMKIGGVQESVTVSGASPVVDVSTTVLATQFTREALELTPTGRNGLFSLAAQLPSVRANPSGGSFDVGGSTPVSAPTMTTQGQTGDNWVSIEGVSAQSPQTETQAAGYVDYASLDEVRAEVSGGDVEAVRRGLKVQMIFKSGGNDFHGGAHGSYTNNRFQGNNITDALRAEGIRRGSPIVYRYDASGELGGRIIRDRLWFYGSGRKISNVDEPFGGVMPDGSQAITPHTMYYAAGKLTYQISPSNKLIGFSNYFRKWENNIPSPFVPWESRTVQDFHGTTSKIEWQGVRGNSLVASAQFGLWDFRNHGAPSFSAPGKVATFDQVTMFRTGNAGGRIFAENRYHPKGQLTWYRPGLIKGDHEFKMGFDYLDQSKNSGQADRGASGNYTLVFANGMPFQIQAYNYPATPRNPVHVLALYGADSWRLSRKLTLNLGLRYSRDNGFVPEICRETSTFAVAECYSKVQFRVWHSIAPRLHAAYDVTGDGKTAIKGGWSRYPQMRGTDELRFANRADATTTTYRWRDLNGNGNYDAGEVNLDPNGPDFVSISGTSNLQPNPSEPQPTNDEFMVALERQLIPDFAVRVAGIYVHKYNVVRLENLFRPYSAFNIPITNRDPGPDGAPNTADDGELMTYYDYPTSLRGRQFERTTTTYDPNADERYATLELSATKRLSNRWQLMAMFSATKKDVPFVNNTGGGNDYPLTTLDPNAEINTADRTWDWQGGLSGAYLLPYQVTVSANYQHLSGRAFGRTVLFRGGTSIPTFVMRVEPMGTRRLQNLNMLDLRVEKTFTLLGNHKVAGQLNVFNATNSATILSASDRSGVTFLRPTAILSPRIVVFSARYSF